MVREGETLWDIAQMYLNDPLMWPEIFRINTETVRDPALIYPSERLLLPEGVASRSAAPTGNRTIFFRDPAADRQGQRLTIRAAGTANVPIVAPGDFYRASVVARDGEIDPEGRLAELISPTVVPIEISPQIQLYDRVFVALEAGNSLRIGDRIHFMRQGNRLGSLGRIYASTGLATVAAIENSVATAVVVRLYDVVAPGDLAVPAARFPVRAGVTPVASRDMDGHVVGFEVNHPVQAAQEIAYLDVGRSAGVREGDEFEAYLPRQKKDWGIRPEIPVARMQVVRVMEGSATVRLTSLDQPAIAVGLPVRRIARMP